MKFLTQAAAVNLDKQLMSVPGFSLDQLMELAGLSVACAVAKVFPDTAARVLALAGPGNNGGDALVAARHLFHFGFTNVSVVYPKPSEGPLFRGLVATLQQLNIPVTSRVEAADMNGADLVLDGVFGFSFNSRGPIRPPFDHVMKLLRETQVPIAAIDIPSGWDVEAGDIGVGVKQPALLISLTAPKLCAAAYKGRHFLGGRFLPPALAKDYDLVGLPAYPGTEQAVDVTGWEPGRHSDKSSEDAEVSGKRGRSEL